MYRTPNLSKHLGNGSPGGYQSLPSGPEEMKGPRERSRGGSPELDGDANRVTARREDMVPGVSSNVLGIHIQTRFLEM